MTIGAIGYLASLLAYLVLTLLLVSAWRARQTGLFALSATLTSIGWAVTGLTLNGDGDLFFTPLALTAELLRNGAWIMLLVHVLVSNRPLAVARLWRLAALAVVTAGAFLMLGPLLLAPHAGADATRALREVVLLGAVLMTIFGVLLVEQLYRNQPVATRWAIKHLCLGLGGLFIYDLFFYSDALLLGVIDPRLWQARGFVSVLVVPLMAVSVARNPSWALEVHVSREVVFHSATLTGAGLYLMAMAGAGYYIRFVGGSWGHVLQIVFLFAAALLLLLLLFSGQLRARLRVLLNEHFFSFKYDYREEWQRFTGRLAQGGQHLPEAVIGALATIVESSGGLLWARHERAGFELIGRFNLPDPACTQVADNDPLPRFLEQNGWPIDLDEYRTRIELYDGLELPDWLAALAQAWLVIPLMFRDELTGFVILTHGRRRQLLNWEDRSLLKTAGLQAASHVAQYQTDQALMQARQFEAFNQLSAYVAHDLKNLLAQQSLLIANAEKHKHNPEFIEDVIRTVRSSVERMQRLMTQLRDGARGGPRELVRLDALLSEAIGRRRAQPPEPQFECLVREILVSAEKDRLLNVFCHLIQNAQEATRADGRVLVRLSREGTRARIQISDDGTGMTAEFIRDRLFRPFDSTKGLTGMGIGAFESRELIRLLGGDLTVHSRPGAGTDLRIVLPCTDADPAGMAPVSANGAAPDRPSSIEKATS